MLQVQVLMVTSWSSGPAGEHPQSTYAACILPLCWVPCVSVGAVVQSGMAYLTLVFACGYCSLAWPGQVCPQSKLMLVGAEAYLSPANPQSQP